jgi:hypothetical protein
MIWLISESGSLSILCFLTFIRIEIIISANVLYDHQSPHQILSIENVFLSLSSVYILINIITSPKDSIR